MSCALPVEHLAKKTFMQIQTRLLANRQAWAMAVVALLTLCLSGCGQTPSIPLVLDESSVRPPTQAPASLLPIGPSPQPAMETGRRTPVIVTGTGVFTNVAATPASSRGVQELAGDEITVGFIEADVKDVVRSLLGTTLRLPFVIDPRVQGTMTLQTSQPVPRRDALLLLESALRANGAALVESAGNYAVVPLADAPGQSGLTRFAIGSAERGQGFGVHVIPLRNISAPEMAKIAQPFLPADRILKADASRPLLIVAGTPQEVSLLLQLVNTFDVDWLKGVSFGMFPLETAKASDLAKELEAMVGTAGGGEREGASGPLAGMVKFVPVDRLNFILVVSQRPQYIAAIRKWIQALDKTKSSDTPRLYVYYPQNSKADALASTLGDIFSSGRGRSGPDFNVAPGQPGADLYSSPGGGAAGPLGGFGGGGFWRRRVRRRRLRGWPWRRLWRFQPGPGHLLAAAGRDGALQAGRRHRSSAKSRRGGS